MALKTEFERVELPQHVNDFEEHVAGLCRLRAADGWKLVTSFVVADTQLMLLFQKP